MHTFSQGKPWTLIRDADASGVDDLLFRAEPFSPIVSEISISGTDPVAFLAQATDLINDTPLGDAQRLRDHFRHWRSIPWGQGKGAVSIRMDGVVIAHRVQA